LHDEAGVQGRIVDSLVDMFFASVSAAACRVAACSVPIAVGWRNGNALLLRSSDSPGTSSSFSVVSLSRSRIVLRYSREVRRRAGREVAREDRARISVAGRAGSDAGYVFRRRRFNEREGPS